VQEPFTPREVAAAGHLAAALWLISAVLLASLAAWSVEPLLAA